MDTLRIARDIGNVSVLLPEGVTHLYDLPYTMFDLIRTGLMYLKFQEMPEDEAPPKRIWMDGDALKSHFREVKERREREMKGEQSSGADVERNAAAASLIVE